MPNCRKLRGAARGNGQVPGRGALMMSVIMEETPHERESREEKRLKPHPEDVPAQDKEPLVDEGHISRSSVQFAAEPTSDDSRPRSTSKTAPSLLEEEPCQVPAQLLMSPPRNSRVSSRRMPSTTQPKPRLPSRPGHRPTPPSRSSLGGMPVSQSASARTEDEEYDRHRKPSRRAAASSLQPRISLPNHRVHRTSSGRRSTSPPSTPQEIPRSKSSTVLGSLRSPCAGEVYNAYPIERPSDSHPRDSLRLKRLHDRHPSSRRSSRKPSDHPRPYSISMSSSSEDELHGHRRNTLACPEDPSFDPSKTIRPSFDSMALSKAPVSVRSARTQRQVSPGEDLKPRTEKPRPKSSTALSSTSPSLLQKAKEQHRFLSAQDAPRRRSSSQGQWRTDSSSGLSNGSIPRSVSTANASTSYPPTLRLQHYEGRFQNKRGQTLFYFSLFPPEKEPLRGVILCLHGLGDHCRRNVSLYERYCMEGFGVITYDLLNHGVSDLDEHKTRAHISNFNHLVEDTNEFVTFAKRSIYSDALRYWRKHHRPRHPHGKNLLSLPELPLIIAGTSFGSLVGLHTVLSGEHKFHAAVWGSPTIGVTWNPMLWAQAKLAKPLVAVFPTAKVVPGVQQELLCRDPAFIKKFQADPLTIKDMMTTRSGQESLQAMIRLQEDERVTDSDSAFCAVPTLFLAGSADGISDQQAAIKFFATMGTLDKEYKLFDGLYHLVYEEPEKEDVLRYLAQWLHRRFPLETRRS